MNLSADDKSELLCVKRAFYALLKKNLERNFFSQATQDLFVLKMLNEKQGGYYLEVGAGDPIDSSNTYLLENLGWNGISIEYDRDLYTKFSRIRRNPIICVDATACDYGEILTVSCAPKRIDYLSLDIDPAVNTFEALRRLPHSDYRFSVITYEHDRYRSGDEYMVRSREFLKSLGYLRVVSNLLVFGKDFEDWWVDPLIVADEALAGFGGDRLEFSRLWSK